MRITVLTHIEKEGAKEFDAVIAQVVKALRQHRHSVSVLGVYGDIKKLMAGLKRRKPELVFNMMETFGDTELGAVALAGLLELLAVRYTGVGPGELYLQEDKALTKKLLAFEHIPYPEFAVFSQNADLETGGNLRMPLFVKPLRMDASIGIDEHSLVHDSTALLKQVEMIHGKLNDSALVEEYIEGREFYIGVLGNQTPIAFPPIEMDFSGLPEDRPHVLNSKAKWDEKSVEFKGTKAIVAEIPDELKARLHKVALDAYRALRVRDYGRVDLRLTPAGEIYVIEVNASCYLEQSGEFAMAAAAAGIEYSELINRIAECASQRYEQQSAGRVHAKRRKRQAV